MKYVLAACAAAFALSTSAFAEQAAAPAAEPTLPPAAASQCTGAMPANPTLPDGATANAHAMNDGNTAYQAWVATMRPVYDCHRNEYLQAAANLRARQAELEPLNAQVGSVTSSWQASVAAFNARPARERH